MNICSFVSNLTDGRTMKVVDGLRLQSIDQGERWDSLPELWERARSIRAFAWTQERADDRAFLSQWLARVKELFGVDFCFATLTVEDTEIDISWPEEFSAQIPSSAVRSLLDRIDSSQGCFVMEDSNREWGFQSLVLTSLPPADDSPIGALLMGSVTPRAFTPPELFVFQSLALDLGWAFKGWQCEKSYQRQLSYVSHELKTPLTVILGESWLLLESVDGILSEKQRQQLCQIKNSAEEILHLIHGLLDLALINEGEVLVTLEEAELADLIRGAVKPLCEKAWRKGIGVELKLAPNLPKKIVTDPLKLRQVIRNLVDNAVKFTFQGRVRVEARMRDSFVEIRVADTGIGIDEKDIEVIFEPFRQLNGQQQGGSGGLGIGLKLVREFVDLLQGNVQVESKPGWGSVFTVSLPSPPPGFRDERLLTKGKFQRISSSKEGLWAKQSRLVSFFSP